jgi:hypothetical protein
VQRDLLGDDGQAEARPVGRRPAPAREGRQQRLALVGRNARAVVLHAHEQGVVVAVEADADTAVGPPVQGGVVEQVVDEQPQPAGPAAQRRPIAALLELEGDVRVTPPRRVQRGVEEVGGTGGGSSGTSLS